MSRLIRSALGWMLALTIVAPSFALTPEQMVILSRSNVPSWVKQLSPTTTQALDFQNGRYWAKQLGAIQPTLVLSFARTGAPETSLLSSSAAGASYITCLANTPCIVPGNGLGSWETRTQYLSNSASPATEATSTLATGTYQLWVNGTGSATLSAGTATGCGTGTATNGTPVSFTITVAGTCNVTVTGSLNTFQVENGAFTTPFIPCTTAPCTRGASVSPYVGIGQTNMLAAHSALIKTFGITTWTNDRLLEFASGQIFNYTSTTQIQINSGSNPTAIATIGGGGTVAGFVTNAFSFGAPGISVISNNGVRASSPTPWGTASGPVYSANRGDGTRALNGYISRIDVSPVMGVYDSKTAALFGYGWTGFAANDNDAVWRYEFPANDCEIVTKRSA